MEMPIPRKIIFILKQANVTHLRCGDVDRWVQVLHDKETLDSGFIEAGWTLAVVPQPDLGELRFAAILPFRNKHASVAVYFDVLDLEALVGDPWGNIASSGWLWLSLWR